jgi:ubiquinone/menaquinone biosynthesis C-methylase UbiE
MPVRALLAALLVAGCSPAETADAIGPAGPAGKPASAFPQPDRPVARIVSDQFSNEDARDGAGEAEKVMSLLGIRPGMAVADIGAGNGYYTVRLSKRVGPAGRVFAEDIVPEYLERLRGRVEAERLKNVTLALGSPHDPRLPVGEIDLALLVHMYHEIEQPYGLLWNLHAALKPGAHVAIVDADRATNRHGTPPRLLACEMAQVGYRQIAFHTIEGADSYLAVFETSDPRPNTANIKPCKG